MDTPLHILLIGAGELGTAFLPHLSALPNIRVSVGVRTPAKYQHLSSSNVSLIPLDITGPSDRLSRTFAEYDIVISATGFGQSTGTLLKLANEILHAGLLRNEAAKSPLWFFPWQWGVDYDITGDGQGLMPLFGEQKEVRNLLRAKAEQNNIKWTIVSTGIFMSFLFEQFWGIVETRSSERIVVRALKDWEHKVTVTDVADTGKLLARIVAGYTEAENRVVYVAGDTVSYKELADIVERVAGKEIVREEWPISHLEAELAKDPDDLIRRYRLVFARHGVWWDKECTVNHKLGIPVMDTGTYAQKLFAAL